VSVNNLRRLAFLNGGLNNYIAKHEALNTHHSRERTDSMIRFSAHEGSVHAIKILEETPERLSIRVGERQTGKLVCLASFDRKHGSGAIWQFRDFGRLWSVELEPDKITERGIAWQEGTP